MKRKNGNQTERTKKMSGFTVNIDPRNRKKYTDGPSYRRWDEDGKCRSEKWDLTGTAFRLDGPVYQKRYEDGQLKFEEWYVDDNKVGVIQPVTCNGVTTYTVYDCSIVNNNAVGSGFRRLDDAFNFAGNYFVKENT